MKIFSSSGKFSDSKIRLCSTVNQQLFSSVGRAFINQITALRGRPIRPSLLETKGIKPVRQSHTPVL